jgi:osmotically-inducible protein OsmY
MTSYKKYLMAGVLFTLASGVGCNQQDADCLSRIGRKMTVHARNGAGEVGAKVDFRWAKREPSLQEKVHDRLRYDTALADAAFEVSVKEKEVELKGTVKTPQQRQRAIDLAETVAGVDKVVDALKLSDDEAAK